jgi:molecular chaperone GrpE
MNYGSRDPFGLRRFGVDPRFGPDRPSGAPRRAPFGGPGPIRASADGRKVNVPVNAPLSEGDEEGGVAQDAPVTEATAPKAAPPTPSMPAAEPEAPVGTSVPLEDETPEDELPYADTAQAPEPEDLEALAAKAGKADQYLELAQRTKADFENFRKRAARDAAAAQERGVVKLAKELLPAVDNLDRALEAQSAANGADDETTLVSGIKLVHADVIAALARVGIEPFNPAGEQFDPQHHEAVAQQPVEGAEPGTIVEVYQRGYRLGDTILRPARVAVAG